MFPGDDNSHICDPPHFDTLSVQFRGDNHEIVLPYCEVANGQIMKAENNIITITVVKNGVADAAEMSYAEFAEAVEKAFDIKEVAKLKVQLAASYETVQIV